MGNELNRVEEDALKESETRYRRLFETAQDGILLLDADSGQIIDINPFLTDLIGYSKEELQNKGLWDIGFFKDINKSKNIVLELKNKGYVRYEDLSLETKDGRSIYVEFVSNVYLVNGKKVIQCNVRDITDRKRIEKALQKSEDRFHTLFENSSAAMAIMNRDTTISMVNKEYCKLSLCEEKDVIGISWTSLIHPEDLGRLLEYYRKRLIDPKSAPDKYEFRVCRKDGKILHCLLSVGLIPTTQQFVCSIVDITERKQAEEELRESEEKYRLLINTAHESVIVAQDGLLKFVNPMTVDLLGVHSSRNSLIDHFPNSSTRMIGTWWLKITGDGSQTKEQSPVMLSGWLPETTLSSGWKSMRP